MAQCLYCNSQCEYTGLNTSTGCSNSECKAYKEPIKSLKDNWSPEHRKKFKKQAAEYLKNLPDPNKLDYDTGMYYPPIIDEDGFANSYNGKWMTPTTSSALISVPEINITIDADRIKTTIEFTPPNLETILASVYLGFERLLSLELRGNLWNKINKVIDLDNFHKIQDHTDLYLNQNHTKLLEIYFNINILGAQRWTIYEYNI